MSSRTQTATNGAASPDQTQSRYRFVMVGLILLLAFSPGLSTFALSPITPLIIDEYGINHSTASLLTGLVFLVHAGFGIPCAMLVGRVGLKKLIALGWLLSSAPVLTFLADDFGVLLALRAVHGVGFAIAFPALGALYMQWFRPKELPLVTGAFIGCFSLAVAISNFAIVPMSDVMGFRPALSVLGTVSLFGVVCWLAFGRAHDVSEGDSLPIRESVLSVLRSRNTLLIAGADAGPFALYTVSLAWLPTFFHEEHGISLASAGSLMGVLSMAGVVSLLLAVLLTFRVRRRRPFLIFPGIVGGFAGLGVFLLAGTPAIYLPLVALGFASWFYLPVLMSLPMELPGANPHRVSVMLATVLAIGGIGTFLGPLTVGAIRDLTGSYVPGLALFAVLAWSLAIGGFLLPETGTARAKP